MNDLAEVFNKTLGRILNKTVAKNKKDWHDRVYEALWAYHTTYRTPTQMTPYSLVFRGEAVLSPELEIPSLRVAINEKLTENHKVRLRLEKLKALEGNRLMAQYNLELYCQQMSKSYDRLVKERVFK